MTALMLSAVSCSEVKRNVSVSEDISDIEQTVENTDDIIITIAITGDVDYINKAVKEFNKTDNGYIIELINYHQNTDEWADFNLGDFELVQTLLIRRILI